MPTATLILIPSRSPVASAYPTLGYASSPWRLVSSLTTGATSLLFVGYDAVTNAVGALWGHQNHASTPATGDTAPTRPAEGSLQTRAQGGRRNEGPRIRTLHDDSTHSAAGRDAMKFYNGNQVGQESGLLRG